MEPTLKDEIQTLKTHYLTVHTIIIGLVIALCLGMGYGVHRVIVGYEAKLAKAQQMEESYRKDAQAAEEARKAEEGKRKALEQEKKTVTHTLVVREQQTTDRVKEVLAPKEVTKVAEDFRDAYNVEPRVVGEDILLDAPSVQIVTATKVERDAFFKDKVDLKKLVELERQRAESFAHDADALKGTLVECNKTIDGYKEVAGVTKKAKILRFLKTSAIVGGVALAAYEVGNHTR